jgi:hypothetical protein
MRVLRAAAWAATLSGIPSTVHAVVTGRDPLDAIHAAGTILLPRETSPGRLLGAGVIAHLGVSLGWTLVLDRVHVRSAGRGAVAGLAIAAIDLGLIGRRLPRIATLPLVPQLADHAAFSAISGHLLDS